MAGRASSYYQPVAKDFKQMISIDKLPSPQNLTTLAYERIKNYLLQGHLEKEIRLSEEFLSKQLGISKSPIREALNCLQAEGLVSIQPRRGTYLRQFSVKEVRDLYGLREALEVFAVSNAEITPDLIEDLKASVMRTKHFLATNDRAGHIVEDVHFHSAISNATGNAALCHVLHNVQNQIWICRCKTYSLSASTTVQAHERVIVALRNGDRRKARTEMKIHITQVRERLIRYLEN
jgi:DNA-binding GntR family transcriptional regulator